MIKSQEATKKREEQLLSEIEKEKRNAKNLEKQLELLLSHKLGDIKELLESAKPFVDSLKNILEKV